MTLSKALAMIAFGMSIVWMSFSPSPTPAQTGPDDVAKVVEGNTAFALDLYGELAKSEAGKNLFCSPYSISTALAMTYGGARGETAAEMAKTLHFPLGNDTLHPAFGKLYGDINGKGTPRAYELVTANRLWGQKGYPYVPEFLKLTQDNYGAGLKEVDFMKATEEAREAINGWVEEQTKDKIKELLKPGILTVDTRLVLTNAIYFKAAWAEPFLAGATKPGEFKLGADKSIADVPMMTSNMETTSLYQDKGLQVATLPYVKNDLSMVIILPSAIDGLPETEKSLKANPGQLGEWIKKSTPKPLQVTMPKFTVTSEFRLDKQLKAMGMRRAFGDADFSGITTAERLFITAVVHKAFVDVNETGTEAAAATAVVLGRKSRPPIFTSFRVDHPFLFLIRDNQTGSILFMGRVVNPKA